MSQPSWIKRRWHLVVIWVVVVYGAFPFVAGLLGLGPDERGPKFYHQTHHSIMYRITYDIVHKEKPRGNFGGRRIWFYRFNNS